MKISALLQEKANYDAQLMGDINAYLISLKANDIPSVTMDMMVRELNGMGYTVRNNKYAKSDKADKDSVRKLAVKTAKNKVKK